MYEEYPRPPYPKTREQADLLDSIRPLLAGFEARATQHDREGSFPFENFKELREVGYFGTVVPKEYGGGGHGMVDIVLTQNMIARADASTAYAAGMHMMSVGGEAASRTWPEALRERIFRDAAENGALINSIASEPELGSPQGGGKLATTMTGTSTVVARGGVR